MKMTGSRCFARRLQAAWLTLTLVSLIAASFVNSLSLVPYRY